MRIAPVTLAALGALVPPSPFAFAESSPSELVEKMVAAEQVSPPPGVLVASSPAADEEGRVLQSLTDLKTAYGSPYYILRGFFFDIKASGSQSQSVRVESVIVANYQEGNQCEVFTRAGTSDGFTHSSAGWTSLGTSTLSYWSTNSLSLSAPQPVVLPGQTQGFHVYCTPGHLLASPAAGSLPADMMSSADDVVTMSYHKAVPYLWSNYFYSAAYQLNGGGVRYELVASVPTPAPLPTPIPTPMPTTPLCTAPTASNYNMCIDTESSGTTYNNGDWTQALGYAKSKWEQIITGDFPDMSPPSETYANAICPNYPTSTIDDLYICAKDQDIDGVYNVVGSAGPRHLRFYNGKYTTTSGYMRFDTADIDRMLLSGTWDTVALHEIGHILGIGTLWNFNTLITGSVAGGDIAYTGAQGCAKWREVTGCVTPNCPPVEMDGGSGTAGGHWDEGDGTSFTDSMNPLGPDTMNPLGLDHELMTGMVDNGNAPISEITVGSLEDMGYTVDYGAADPYTPPAAFSCSRRERERNLLRGREPTVRYLDGDKKVRDLAQGGGGGGGGEKPKTAAIRKPKLSAEGKTKAVNEGKRILKEARSQKKRMSAEEADLFVGEQYVDIIYEEPGEGLFFVGVTGPACRPNGSECGHSDDCCSDSCHGNGKCVGK